MANIQPITSEEVLERQVRESIEATPSGPQGDSASSTMGQSSGTSTSAVLKGAPSQTASSVAVAPKESTELRSGFNYRLPLGVYIIAYNYIVIALAAFVAALFNTMLHLQGGDHLMDSGGLWAAIEMNRSLWIVSILSTVVYAALLSARNLARWTVIAICSGVAVYAAVQIFRISLSMSETSFADMLDDGFIMTSVLYAMLPLFAMTTLVLVTVAYLLRSKIAAIYE